MRFLHNQSRVILSIFLFYISFQMQCAILPGASAEEALSLYARSAVLMDGDSGRILYGKDASVPLPMASTTKIMTCILALEQADGSLLCTASGNAAAQPAVKLGMRKGEQFYLKDLLYSLMLESHNDTAVCVAESIAGSVGQFAALMNQKAAELGCTDTYYITPNGLDAEDMGGVHHTTAAELASVLRYCITVSPKADDFLAVTRTMNYTFTDLSGQYTYSCVNHNAFLTMMEGALTGKTGFTGNAGYCYVGALEKDDRLFLVALLACGWPSHKTYKWSDTRELMNYGLANYQKRVLTSAKPDLEPLPVTGGQSGEVPLRMDETDVAVLMRPEEQTGTQVELPGSLPAPVQEGTQVGTVTYIIEGEPFFTQPVFTAASVEKIDFPYCFRQIVQQWTL